MSPALWLAGIAEVAAALPRIREQVLVASLAGPVGTLAGLGDKGPEVIGGVSPRPSASACRRSPGITCSAPAWSKPAPGSRR